ncbi:MAG: hypothetical protein ACFE94_00055 [Candidatus Hodarchaeota archaeon]
MKKKKVLLIILVFLVEIPFVSKDTLAFYCNILSFEVDKDFYYTNEEIRINASWELNYNPSNEYGYIQIHIYDSLDNIIWNSSEYDNIGQFTEGWIVNITSLKTMLLNYSNTVFIRFFHYFWDGDGSIEPIPRETKEIIIFKRIPLCELYGFRDRINYGEDLTFMAHFYDDIIENNPFLCNQLILFMISVNNSIIFEKNFTTNHLGIIEVSISSMVHLNIGLNKLTFIFLQNKVYNDSIFQYEIFLDKNPIFVDIIDYDENLTKKEDIIIHLIYYYFLNDSIIPLDNQNIEVEILWNQSLIFTQIFKTDNYGVLLVIIPYELLNFTSKIENLKLTLVYNGTVYMENKTISLNINISNSKRNNILNSNVILFTILSISSLLILFPLLYRFKKGRKKLLTEITIRY